MFTVDSFRILRACFTRSNKEIWRKYIRTYAHTCEQMYILCKSLLILQTSICFATVAHLNLLRLNALQNAVILRGMSLMTLRIAHNANLDAGDLSAFCSVFFTSSHGRLHNTKCILHDACTRRWKRQQIVCAMSRNCIVTSVKCFVYCSCYAAILHVVYNLYTKITVMTERNGAIFAKCCRLSKI